MKLLSSLVGLCLVLAVACGGGDGEKAESNKFGLTSEVVAAAGNVDAIAFAPDGRLFFAEHWTGAIRVVGADGHLLPDPWATVPKLAANLYWGLTGLAIDPSFQSNGNVYALYTELVQAGPPQMGKPVVVRFRERGGKGTDMQVIVGDLPVADGSDPVNVNGRLHFGPDGFLYLTLGDYDKPLKTGPSGEQFPQDLASPIGKVLRVNKEDGSAPADNPFIDKQGADARIFAYGFRQPFDFAFQPESGRMYGSDNGGRTCEELNIIEKGVDYGWPRTGQSPFDCGANPQRSPIYMISREGLRPNDLDSTVGVSSVAVISGGVYPALKDSLVICDVVTQHMRRLALAPPNFDSVTANDVVQPDCLADVAVSPGGIIYYSTTYEVRRLVPPPETPSPQPTSR